VAGALEDQLLPQPAMAEPISGPWPCSSKNRSIPLAEIVRVDGIAFPPCFLYFVGKLQYRHDTVVQPALQSDRHGG
jgi:hypothetical protein